MDIKEAQFSVTQTVGGNNYGNMNVSKGNINSINVVNQVEKEELVNIISYLKTAIMTQDIEEEKKDIVLDDLDTIEEQINSEKPKTIKIKKAFEGIKNFISNLPSALATGTLIATKAEELYSKLKPLIEI
ncbi:MAG: hypothetical protein E7J22_00860 [Clostridium perfringens]|nr:hypothetical protein [Clostridium perfringens]MDU7962874.1 hypothetical protein [Clostridium perfringens]